MKVRLMYRDRDFDPDRKLPSNEQALIEDLQLDVLFGAMANGDRFLLQAAKQVVLSGFQNDKETILYRQAIMKDCLLNGVIVRSIYDIAVESIENRRKNWLGVLSHSPAGILYDSVQLLGMFVGMLRKLRALIDPCDDQFHSDGFISLLEMVKREFTEDYLFAIDDCLKEFQFGKGVLISAQLGENNEGAHYSLRKSLRQKQGWIERIFVPKELAYTFHIADRDEAGFRALSELRDQGTSRVASALAQAADHITAFFDILRVELAFYIGCVNLRHQLDHCGSSVCFPVPELPGSGRYSCGGLIDICLALNQDKSVVGNDLAADKKNLVIITGANQGGKSTFLRAIGCAQLMMQCGMFVTADYFGSDICRGLFTHYKREEDVSLNSGKFDEELNRMSGIIDALTPDSIVLFNESFSATNEMEGSEIAGQIVRALLELRVKVFFVTHMHEFAHGFWVEGKNDGLFLRAERQSDGRRTFKLLPGEPLQTSFGKDLYNEIFMAEDFEGAQRS